MANGHKHVVAFLGKLSNEKLAMLGTIAVRTHGSPSMSNIDLPGVPAGLLGLMDGAFKAMAGVCGSMVADEMERRGLGEQKQEGQQTAEKKPFSVDLSALAKFSGRN